VGGVGGVGGGVCGGPSWVLFPLTCLMADNLCKL
jgi:hypothetical protein